jgi:hypothetical protein
MNQSAAGMPVNYRIHAGMHSCGSYFVPFPNPPKGDNAQNQKEWKPGRTMLELPASYLSLCCFAILLPCVDREGRKLYLCYINRL